ncbi:hypothetical protein SAMN06272721_101122 [Arthrobacter sp. P2b]|nr:hypothetical protein SAMN06272721_101122 [Arthrobacter sp. P2b]
MQPRSFAVGAGTGISYEPGAPLATNLSSFLLYSLVTSTADANNCSSAGFHGSPARRTVYVPEWSRTG